MKSETAIRQRQRNPDQTRAAILEAAFHEIHAHGFQAASLERILSQTGVTKGALYHHFPSKHALGLAVVEEVISEMIFQQRMGGLAETDDPVGVMVEKIEAFALEFDPQLAALGCPMNNLIQEMSPLDEDFHDRLTAILENWRELVAKALKRGKARGAVRADLDCDAAALFIVASIQGIGGLTKALTSEKIHRGVLDQLRSYVLSLSPSGAGSRRGGKPALVAVDSKKAGGGMKKQGTKK